MKKPKPAHALQSLMSLLLCTLMLFGLLPITASAVDYETEEVARLAVEFKNVKRYNEFTSQVDPAMVGITNLGNHEMMITEKDAIHGISARIHYADMSWWGFNLVDKSFRINADFRFYEAPRTLIYFDLGTDHRLLGINTVDGKPCLFDRNSKNVYTFDYNTDYTVELQFTRSADTYDLFVNGEPVADDVRLSSPIHAVTYARWQFADGDVMFDNFHIYGEARKLPATNSMQPVEEMPEIDYPAPYEKTGEYRVYHNTVRQDIGQDDLFVDETNAYLTADKAISILEPKAKYDAAAHTVTVGETVFDITEHIVTQNDREMLSLASLNAIFGAKVWLDRGENMIFLTTGSYMNDNFLRACDYKFVMNGEPYYELSFNKFNLALKIQDYFFGGERDKSILEAEEASLKTLSENGFTSVRVFLNDPWQTRYESIRTEAGKETYYKAMDYMYDLCDKYGIRVIVSFQLEAAMFVAHELIDGVWVNTSGDIDMDIVATPESESRKTVDAYLDEYVGRYKDRDTILMWEVSNEMSLDMDVRSNGVPSVSAIQLGNFYAHVAEQIHAIDNNHLVDSGDAGMRPTQYNMLLESMAGVPITWKADTQEEHNKVLWILNHGLDVISAHSSEPVEWFENYINCSKAWNKPFYLGETGDLPEGPGLTVASPESLVEQKAHLEKLLGLGIQLSTWWAFDAPMIEEYNNAWNVTLETTPDLFYAIADTNQKLKEKWIVNGVTLTEEKTPATALLSAAYAPLVTEAPETSGEGTSDVGTGSVDTEPKPAGSVSTGVIIAVVAAVVVCGLGAALVISKKKKG